MIVYRVAEPPVAGAFLFLFLVLSMILAGVSLARQIRSAPIVVRNAALIIPGAFFSEWMPGHQYGATLHVRLRCEPTGWTMAELGGIAGDSRRAALTRCAGRSWRRRR